MVITELHLLGKKGKKGKVNGENAMRDRDRFVGEHSPVLR